VLESILLQTILSATKAPRCAYLLPYQQHSSCVNNSSYCNEGLFLYISRIFVCIQRSTLDKGRFYYVYAKSN